jgi:Holliday junction resolvasome RuvABC endonuclease subunit
VWLAIDPSLRNTGWALMDTEKVYDVGLIHTKRDSDRLVYLDNQRCLSELSNGIRHAPRYTPEGIPRDVYMEAKGGSKSAKAAAAMAMAQGVMIGALECDHPIHLILPQEVKKRFCGDRRASKDDIRVRVDELYPEAFGMMVDKGFKAKKYNEHIYDAIAIGWAINQRRNG